MLGLTIDSSKEYGAETRDRFDYTKESNVSEDWDHNFNMNYFS